MHHDLESAKLVLGGLGIYKEESMVLEQVLERSQQITKKMLCSINW